MFGVVPKVLWADACDVDEFNRIDLATRTLIAVDREKGRVILTDTGCGSKWSPDQAKRYAVQSDSQAIDRALRQLGFARESVTDVVVTHLHFDHNGGLTDWLDEPGGKTAPRYPRAKHWIHRRQWEHAQHPHLKDRASYFKQDFDGLEEKGLWQFVEGQNPDAPYEGLAWFVTHGHTPYQIHPVFGTPGSQVLFVGDIVPTAVHLRPAWVMAYDVEPMRTIDEKIAIYRRCDTEGWGLAFAHDPKSAGARIGGGVDKPVVAEALDLSPGSRQ